VPRNGSLTDDEQDQAFAKVVELGRERAKALYLHKVREIALNSIAYAFDEGFEAAMELCASDEIACISGNALKPK
jgi:hypothetical protein